MRDWRLLLILPLPLALGAFYFTRTPGSTAFFISLDTVRADRLGCYGYKAAQRPFIDRLAASGTAFDHAITAAPFTPSSHAAMFTGLCPCEHGVRYAWRFRRQQLNPSVKTLAAMFKAAGYATAAFVSARPLDKRIHSLDRGFDFYDQSFMDDKSRKGEEKIPPEVEEGLGALGYIK